MKKEFGKIKGLIVCLLFFSSQPLRGHAGNQPEFSQWNFEMTGEERFRAEYKKDFDLNHVKDDTGDLFYQRLRIGTKASLTDEYLKPKLEIYVEGLDAQCGSHDIPKAVNQVDDLDFHQAYVGLMNLLDSGLDLKIGRQELKYGKGRLIAAPTWANRIRAFDGGVLHFQKDSFWTDAFWCRDVKYDDSNLNESDPEESLSGVYGGYQEHKMAPLIEAYVFSLKDTKGTTDTERNTAGFRTCVFLAEGLMLEVEIPYQFGYSGTTTSKKKDIRAWAFHADLSQSWEEATWKPRLSLTYDEASGDKDPKDGENNSFSPLYQSTHDPYGLLDLFRWQNVRNPEISMTFSPSESFKFTPQLDFFWLNNKSDSWYNSSGSAFRTKTSGDRSSYVGSELSFRGFYDYNKNLKIELGYAHFFTGSYAEDTGTDDDVDWAYSQIIYKY